MKALALLVACLALGVSSPSYARFVGGHGVPPRPGPITRPGLPQGGGGHGSGGHESGWRPHGWGYGNNDGAGLGFPDSYAEPTSDQTADAPPLILPPPMLPPAPQCQAAAPTVVEQSGPRIIYIGQAPPTPVNMPKVIYGTE